MTLVPLPRTEHVWRGQCIPISAQLVIDDVDQIPVSAEFTARIAGSTALYMLTYPSDPEADGLLAINGVTGIISGEIPKTITKDWPTSARVHFHLEAVYSGTCAEQLDDGVWIMRYHPKHDET